MSANNHKHRPPSPPPQPEPEEDFESAVEIDLAGAEMVNSLLQMAYEISGEAIQVASYSQESERIEAAHRQSHLIGEIFLELFAILNGFVEEEE